MKEALVKLKNEFKYIRLTKESNQLELINKTIDSESENSRDL